MKTIDPPLDTLLHSELSHRPPRAPRREWHKDQYCISGPDWAGDEIDAIGKLCVSAEAALGRLEAVRDGESDSDRLRTGYTERDISSTQERVTSMIAEQTDVWQDITASQNFDSAVQLRSLLNDKATITRLSDEIQEQIAIILQDNGGDKDEDRDEDGDRPE